MKFSDYIDDVFIPAFLGHVMDELGTALELKPSGRNYTSPMHLEKYPYTRDKSGARSVELYANRPYIFIDHRGKDYSRTVVDVLAEVRNESVYDAVRNVADKYGIPKYEDRSNKQEQGEAMKAVLREEGYREAQATFKSALWKNTEQSSKALGYLRNERGYTDDYIKKAGFGLVTHDIISKLPETIRGDFMLLSEDTKTGETSYVFGPIGGEFTLTIPYRSNRRLLGFKVRKAEKTDSNDKYRNTTSLPISSSLFGFDRSAVAGADNTLILVEGELDAMHIIESGFDNVAGTAGGAIKDGQVEQSLKAGVSKFILLFDNDDKGREFTRTTREAIIKKASEDGKRVSIYVATLNDCKDADEYICTHGSAKFRTDVLGQSSDFSRWDFRQELSRFHDGSRTDTERNESIDRLETILGSARDTDMNLYSNDFKSYEDDYGTDFQTLQAEAMRYHSEAEAKRMANSLSEAQYALKHGDMKQAEAIMQKHLLSVGERDTAQSIADTLLHRKSVDEELDDFRSGDDLGLYTHYEVMSADKTAIPIFLNVGVSFVCANTGHGKTSLLNCMALNVARDLIGESWNEEERNTQDEFIEDGGSVLYYSYEIRRKQLLADFINLYNGDNFVSNNPLKSIKSFLHGEEKYVRDESRERLRSNIYRFMERYIRSGAICIDDTSPSVEDMLKSIDRFTQGGGKPVLVVVDYAQLLRSDEGTMQRTEEVKDMMQMISNFANSHSIPFLLAAQFNRAVECPADMKPNKIGEASDFEKIADTIIGVFKLDKLQPVKGDSVSGDETARLLRNAHYYGGSETYPPKNNNWQRNKDLKPIQNSTFISLMKNRGGDSGNAVLGWDGKLKSVKVNGDQDREQELEKSLMGEKGGADTYIEDLPAGDDEDDEKIPY